MTAGSIAERIAAVRAEIEQACQRAGRSSDTVTLIAVSKTHPAEAVIEAAAAGQRHFGENRVEEALPKMAAADRVRSPLCWHLIGHVQSRKARYVTPDFTLVHSLDSLALAERLSRSISDPDKPLHVLLEVNVSGEASKEGWTAADWQTNTALRQTLWHEIKQVVALPGLAVRGLMTMAPIADDPQTVRPVFAKLRTLRDALANDFPQGSWDELSMGMSDDYPVAIEQGATLVRIGRAIFGPRDLG